jgi:hypothetical protein
MNSDYYEVDLPLGAIDRVYKHESITELILSTLNPDVTEASIEADAIEIGYPWR